MRNYGAFAVRAFSFLVLTQLPTTLRSEVQYTNSRTIAVLPTTDTSGTGLGAAVQQAFAERLQAVGSFNVQPSAYILTGFSKDSIESAFSDLGTELATFAYLEETRISLILFDRTRMNEYVVAPVDLVDPNPAEPNAAVIIEHNLNAAFGLLMALYNRGEFSQLPSPTAADQVAEAATGESLHQARSLFEELTLIHDKPFYFGASLGLARVGYNSQAMSNMDLGFFTGLRFAERSSAELSLDLFSQVMVMGRYRYSLPILERKYVHLFATANLGITLGKLTDNLGSESTKFPVGSIVVGPGLGLEIPLLGAQIRGDFRFLMGAGSLLFANYGITYGINL